MTELAGFGRFVALDEHDAPRLLVRMSKHELPVDGERYGVFTRLIAMPGTTPVELGAAVLQKLLATVNCSADQLGAIVLSSRVVEIERMAGQIASDVGVSGPAYGIERACSGFPAATELGLGLCRETQRPVAVIAAEVISPSINWEPPLGDETDHQRARGQASKLFGDGAAAVMIVPPAMPAWCRILDAWSAEVADEKQLIQKTPVEDAMDPWGRVRPGSTDCMSMPGRRGFLLVRRAPALMAESLATGLKRVGDSAGEQQPPVSAVVPHQANGLIVSRLEDQLGGKANGTRVWNCIRDAGNTVSASIPLAMTQVQDRLPLGAIIGMPSVGAGGPGYRPDVLSTGCVLIRTS